MVGLAITSMMAVFSGAVSETQSAHLILSMPPADHQSKKRSDDIDRQIQDLMYQMVDAMHRESERRFKESRLEERLAQAQRVNKKCNAMAGVGGAMMHSTMRINYDTLDREMLNQKK